MFVFQIERNFFPPEIKYLRTLEKPDAPGLKVISLSQLYMLEHQLKFCID